MSSVNGVKRISGPRFTDQCEMFVADTESDTFDIRLDLDSESLCITFLNDDIKQWEIGNRKITFLGKTFYIPVEIILDMVKEATKSKKG